MLTDYVMQQILEYHRYGFEILGIIGANRSPNCVVETTSDYGEETPGKGVFIEGLTGRLSEEKLDVPLLGIKNTDDAVERVRALL